MITLSELYLKLLTGKIGPCGPELSWHSANKCKTMSGSQKDQCNTNQGSHETHEDFSLEIPYVANEKMSINLRI